MIDKIEVSVICNTYNHEKYIRDALESFISQKTTFKFGLFCKCWGRRKRRSFGKNQMRTAF